MGRLDEGRNRVKTTGARVNKTVAGKNYAEFYDGKGCPLSSYINEYYKDNQQKVSDYKQKDEIRNWIEASLQRYGFDYACYIVGSTSNGFGTKNSDVDICLVVNHEREQVNKSESMRALKKARSSIRYSNHGIGNMELIPAKVPILRMFRHSIQIDLNCNNLTGLRNTWLLNAYSASSPKIKEPRIKPLSMFIKKIAKLCDINDPMNGTLSSYSFNLMLIHFCQTREKAILPVIQTLCPDIHICTSLKALPMLIKSLPEWKVNNRESLGELLLAFFEFYAKFDFNLVISVRLGKALTIDNQNLLKPDHDSLRDKNIRIEEPFDGTNTARAVYMHHSYLRVKHTFQHVAKVLKRCMDSGEDLYELLEKDIKPSKEDYGKFLADFKAGNETQKALWNTGGHITIDSDESFDGSNDEFETTDTFVQSDSTSEEEVSNGKRKSSSTPIHRPAKSQRLTYKKEEKQGEEKTETDLVSVDEGVCSKESIIDLTSENEEDTSTKTTVLDEHQKEQLRKLLRAKMRQQELSSDSSDEDSDAVDTTDDIIIEKVLPPRVKKVFKRRNEDLKTDNENVSLPVQYPRPKEDDTLTPEAIMQKLLEADKYDEDFVQ